MKKETIDINLKLRPATIKDLSLLQHWGEIEENCRALDIWIGEEDDLGNGYGTKMMNLAIERCFANLNIHTIWIDPLESNKDAIRFYERLGFEFVEKRRFGEDDCAVYRLKREDWK